MSLFLDQKYLLLISNTLPLFKKKSDHLYNCRCPICGDSAKNTRKARGYFYHHKNELLYKCHNCDASMAFSSFLKDMDGNLYSQYALEKYAEGNSVKLSNTQPEFKFEEPVFKPQEERLLDKIVTRLDTLPEDHEAVVFCSQRHIPKSRYKQLYFIEDIRDITQLSDKYKASIKTSEPRLVLPFYNMNNQLTGVTCRALRGEALRYITIKIKDDEPLIFGIDNIDKTRPIHVVEGPIDSLFIDNCIAAGGTSFGKIGDLGLPKDKLIMIFDNQPRNKEVCNIISKFIEQNYKVVVWPQTLEEKDINDMVIAGKNVKDIIKKNTFSGLQAKASFAAWKRC